MRVIVVLLAAILGVLLAAILAACQPPASAPDTPAEPRDPDPEVAAPRQPAAPSSGMTVRKVDPLTLEDRPGFEPLTLGGTAAWDVAVAPGGEAMATTVGPPDGGEAAGQRLALVDLDRWSLEVTDITARSTGLHFAPGGEALWWLDDHAVVRRWEPGSDGTTDVPLPGGLWSASVTPLGGGRAAVYGQVLEGAWSESVGPPRLVIVEDGTIVGDIRLDGVSESRTRSDDGLHVMAAGLAWDVRQARLYVVDPESGDVTVVDLERGRILAGGRTIAQRLASWAVPAAHAKLLEGVQLTAELDQAGDRLYVTGTRDGGPFGLRLIDTATLQEVARSNLSVWSVTPTPDDARLFAPAVTGEPGWLVISAETLEVVDRLDREGWLAGFTSDSRHGYITSHRHDEEWTEVVDLATGEVVAEREGRYLPEAGLLVTWPLR